MEIVYVLELIMMFVNTIHLIAIFSLSLFFSIVFSVTYPNFKPTDLFFLCIYFFLIIINIAIFVKG